MTDKVIKAEKPFKKANPFPKKANPFPKKAVHTKDKKASFEKRLLGFARARKYRAALTLFSRIEDLGKPSATSYASIINCCSRAGDTQNAILFREKMISSWGLRSASEDHVISALVKGLALDSQLYQAFEFIKAVAAVGPLPTFRTFNHFFRGCLRTGSIKPAVILYLSLEAINDSRVTPLDVTSVNTLVEMLCGAGMSDIAVKLFERAGYRAPPQSKSVRDTIILASLARCHAVLAISVEFRLRENHVFKATKLIHDLRSTHKSRTAYNPEDESQRLFLLHRLEESESLILRHRKRQTADNGLFVFHSPDLVKPEDWTPEGLNERLSSALWGSYGLPWAGTRSRLRKSFQSLTWKEDNRPCWATNLDWNKDLSPHHDIRNSKVVSRTRKIVDSIDEALSKSRKLIVELGCGDGEWISKMAEHESDSLFIANEIRWSRCIEISRNRAFYNAEKNMIILGGDAATILGHYVRQKSVDCFHINFPEVPHNPEGTSAWISTDFLTMIYT